MRVNDTNNWTNKIWQKAIFMLALLIRNKFKFRVDYHSEWYSILDLTCVHVYMLSVRMPDIDSHRNDFPHMSKQKHTKKNFGLTWAHDEMLHKKKNWRIYAGKYCKGKQRVIRWNAEKAGKVGCACCISKCKIEVEIYNEVWRFKNICLSKYHK